MYIFDNFKIHMTTDKNIIFTDFFSEGTGYVLCMN